MAFFNYNASFLLQCVLRFSANQSCVESARKFLRAMISGDDEALKREFAYAGSFMTACAKGDFFDAYKRADTHNKLALELGMKEFFANPHIAGDLPTLEELK